MTYKIIYAMGKCHNYAHSRKDLLEWLELLRDEVITDIRKEYKSGISDSVLEKYRSYINKTKTLASVGSTDKSKTAGKPA